MWKSARFFFIGCVFLAVTPKWAESCSDSTLLEFPDSNLEIGRGSTRVLACSASDPLAYTAWYRASEGQLVLWRISAWVKQNATYELKNASETHEGLYVCKIDTDKAREPVQSYSFELKVVEVDEGSGMSSISTRGPTQREIGTTKAPTLVITEKAAIPTQSSQSDDRELLIPILVGVIVVQLICLCIICAILIVYWRKKKEKTPKKTPPLKRPASLYIDIERAPNGGLGGTLRIRKGDDTPDGVPATAQTRDRAFKMRSKSLLHSRKRHATDDSIELDLKKKSFTAKKKHGTATKPDKSILRKTKSVFSKQTSKKPSPSDEEVDRSPSIVPTGKTRSFSVRERGLEDGVDFLPLSPDASSIGPLMNDPDNDPVQWDTYHSLMESMTSIDLKQEKVKAGLGAKGPQAKKKKHEKKKAKTKKSEIDAFMGDEDYWNEVRSSTPKRVRSSRLRGYPGGARRVGSSDTPFPKTSVPETAMPSYHKRTSVDTGRPNMERYPTGKAARVLINPSIQDTNFTPNLVRRLKNMYDQGITTIEIT